MVLEHKRTTHRRAFASLATTAWHILGLVVLFVFGIFTRGLGGDSWINLLTNEKTGNIYLVLLAYLTIAWLNRKQTTFIGTGAIGTIAGNGTLIYLGVFAVVAVMRIPYERSYMILSLVFSIIWIWLAYRSLSRGKPRMGIIPGGFASEVQQQREIDWVLLDSFDLDLQAPIEGLVVDFGEPMNPQKAQVVSIFALRGMPIHHADVAYEQITGRVSPQHLTEKMWKALHFPRIYPVLKRVMDICLVTISLPLTLPIMLAVAVLIRLDSPGPALFWQSRTGLRGKTFKMLKFRTMHHSVGDTGSPFVTPGDDRVTRIGYTLRVLRLNELPQLLNVLKGEMSLIGPRPEQLVLTERYEKTLPLYMYRYNVQPGITGWAQTMQGYAASDKEIEIKLSFDLYYVKHFSLWLDLLIFWRTIASLVSGFGGR